MPQPFRFSVSLGAVPIDRLTVTARRAEELGYSTATLPDHLTENPAPLIGLAAVAAATTEIGLLPLVLANDFRNPAILAKEIATLDALSAGRVELGIGAGWLSTDYEFSGIPNDTPGTRIARLRESVDIVRGLLAGERVDIDGTHYQVHGELAPPLPARPGGPPVMLAGGKQKMLTLAGEKADIVGINPGLTAGVIDERAGRDATRERTDEKIRWVRDAAGPRFGDLELQTRIHLAMITDDRDAVAAELAPLLGLTADDALGSPHALLGTAAQCTDEIRRWRDTWGISYVSIDAGAMEDFAPVVEALTGR